MYFMEMDKKVLRLEELNKICRECQERAMRRYEPINPKDCMYCKTGIEVHALEREEWNKIDWNSSAWEYLYRN